MSPEGQVLGLLKGPLGQRHLTGRLLSHFWGLGRPLGLAVWVKKAIALSSLLKGTRQRWSGPAQPDTPRPRQTPEDQNRCVTGATWRFLT